jgi:hypothetical protein
VRQQTVRQLKVGPRRTLAVVAIAAALLLSACSGGSSATSSSEQSSPSTSPSVPVGIPLNGWQVFPWTCQTRYAPVPTGDTNQFDHVTGLLFCVSHHTSTSIGAGDAGFTALMKALSAPDELGGSACPSEGHGQTPSLLVVLASTPTGNYRVKVPNGVCGALQPALSRALHVAAVDVPVNVTAS